eukprot:1154208-Pelagomonas_calceolata.AAC.5
MAGVGWHLALGTWLAGIGIWHLALWVASVGCYLAGARWDSILSWHLAGIAIWHLALGWQAMGGSACKRWVAFGTWHYGWQMLDALDMSVLG